MMDKKDNNVKKIWWVLGIILGIGGIIYFIWRGYREWSIIEQGIEILKNNIWIAYIEIILMIINVLLETWRWRIIDSERIGKNTFTNSILTITESIAMSAATPIGVGEHIGKMRRSEDKKGTIIASVVGSIIQTIVIVAMGLIGIVICCMKGTYYIDEKYLIVEISLLTLLLISVIYASKKISKKVSSIFEEWGIEKISKVLLINIFRFLVFAYQMYIIVTLNIIPSDINITGCIMVYYMLITIVPSSGIADMGIRGSVATAILGIWGGVAAIMVFIINRVIPGIIGLISIILNHHIFGNHVK